jgi:phage/plasmid-like protein (TIGR03299 family)
MAIVRIPGASVVTMPEFKVPAPTPEPTQASPISGASKLYKVSNGHDSIASAIEAVPELAGTVALEPLYLADGSKVPDQNATVRTLPDGSRQALGVVGSRYHVLQDNRSVDLLRPLEARGELNSFNAGAYRAKTWLYGELVGARTEIVPGDEIALRALIGNSHDGSIPWTIGFPGIRVVCQNTFHMALSSRDSKVLRLRHTVASEDIIKQIEELLVTMGGQFLRTADQFRHLAARTCREEQLKEYTAGVFGAAAYAGMDDSNTDDSGLKGSRIYNRILENFSAGQGADLSRGTFWGAYNAATEFLSHQRGRGTENARFADLQWGQAADLSKRALTVALEMAR